MKKRLAALSVAGFILLLYRFPTVYSGNSLSSIFKADGVDCCSETPTTLEEPETEIIITPHNYTDL